MSVEHFQVRMQRLISPRLARLSLQRPNLPLHFLNDVADAQQIRFCRLEFAERFFLLRFVFRNPCGFFEYGALLFRSRETRRVTRTSCQSTPSSLPQFVNVSETSPNPTGFRESVPLKITSAI